MSREDFSLKTVGHLTQSCKCKKMRLLRQAISQAGRATSGSSLNSLRVVPTHPASPDWRERKAHLARP